MNEAPFLRGWDEEDEKKLKIQQTHTKKKFGTHSHTRPVVWSVQRGEAGGGRSSQADRH